MLCRTSEAWCSVFEAIDDCSTIQDLCGLAVTSLGSMFGSRGGSVEEVLYAGGSLQLRRHFVTGSLECQVAGFVADFPRIWTTLLGGAERDQLSVYLMTSRLDRARSLDFDPTRAWGRSAIKDVLTMRISCGSQTDFYFTFNRGFEDPDFSAEDMDGARMVFFMLSATARRIVAQERLFGAGMPDTPGRSSAIQSAIRMGDRRYQLSRFTPSNAEKWARLMERGTRPSRAGQDAPPESVVCIRPSGGADTMASLTPAERTVASLAAQGSANKEIARTLMLSVYTVENHLKSVYRKLGISGRGVLARKFALGL